MVAGQWFSPGTLVSSTKKTDRHDIAEILLKVALNTITLTANPEMKCSTYHFGLLVDLSSGRNVQLTISVYL
jgi:hypothetical protein